jgi:hypothetical protein
MLLREDINLILLVADGLLEFSLAGADVAGEAIALVLLIGEFLLEVFDAGVVLVALHAQLILQPLDGLRLVAARLQHVVLHARQLLPQGSVLQLHRLQFATDLAVTRLVLPGRRQPRYLILEIPVAIDLATQLILVIQVELGQFFDLHLVGVTLFRCSLRRFR